MLISKIFLKDMLTNKKKYLEWLAVFCVLLCCFMVAYFNINVLVKMFIILLCSAIILIWILKVYVQGENYIIWAMSWAIGSVNTPVLTMLSSDLNLRKHADMISNKDQGVWKMYKKCLTFYFLT